jgi:ribose transport system permease protein
MTAQPEAKAIPVEGGARNPEPKGRRSRGGRPRRRLGLESVGTPIFFLLFFVVIGLMKGSAFVSWDNISLVIRQNSYAALLAAAVTLPLIAGQFDLSVGNVAGLSAILCGHLSAELGTPLWISILAALATGVLFGLINGLLVTRAQINAFIATLGTGGAAGGAALWVSNGSTIFSGIPESLTKVSHDKFLSVPLPVFFIIFVGAILWALTRRSVAGRYWYATGANPEAARYAGVKVNTMVVWAFVVTGFLAALAGVLYLSIFATADPKTGPDLLLPAFAAAFLGSSILSDGRFTIIGSILGTFLLAYAENGLQVAGVNFAAQPVFNAIVLIGAVGLTEHLRRRRQARRTTAAA